MAVNQQGIAISIKAFLPMGKSLDDQLAALNLVKTAHETGDYAALLSAAHDVEVKTEQKTRRVEAAPATPGVSNPAQEPITEPKPEPQTEEEPAAEAGQVDTHEWATTQAEEALPFETAPEQQPARARRKVNGNE